MSNFTFIDHTDQVKAALEKAKEQILTAWSIHGASNCANELENAPRRVDTGRLKTSINGRVQGNSAVISTAVEYAIYVHEGTRYMTPNRFLRNGLVEHVDEYRELMEHIVKSTTV